MTLLPLALALSLSAVDLQPPLPVDSHPPLSAVDPQPSLLGAEPRTPAAPEVPPVAEPSPWELGIAAGGGWDSNPLSSTTPAGSGFGAARAWVARELRASDDDNVWLQLGYDGARYEALADADLDRPEASAEWGHRFGAALTLRAMGFGALRIAGDPARGGWDAGARALARLRLGGRFGLRVGAGWTWREASDPAYSASTGRLEAGFDVTPWRGASAVARYTLDAGTDTVWSATGTGGSGSGWRGGGTGSGASAASRVTQGGALDLRQALWGGLFVQAGYRLGVVRAQGTSFLEQQVAAEVGWSR